ncbi:hypothetical protein MBANPS3_010840 [Mucor bainieri]
MENLNSWHLPFDARLGTDITTKLILSNKTVINTVVQNLLGSSIPNNTYTTSSAEWADGKRSDLLYNEPQRSTGVHESVSRPI